MGAEKREVSNHAARARCSLCFRAARWVYHGLVGQRVNGTFTGGRPSRSWREYTVRSRFVNEVGPGAEANSSSNDSWICE